MSVRYIPVQWNRNKWLYDAALVAAIAAYVLAFLELGAAEADRTRPVDGAILRMRAFGTCAFLMLTVVLAIGPLARLDRRFLPLLYNRRHFGVLTALVAFTHAAYVVNWYFVFAPTPRLENLLGSNTAYGQLLGFPIEALGLFALFCLGVLAATSHDFWLSFLGAPLWKALHLAIYPAYAAVVAHIWLGYLQDQGNPAFALVAGLGALTVAGLHLAARGRPEPRLPGDWIDAGRWDAIPDGRAVIVRVGAEERAAIFRNGATLSAVSNACAHQNGPLGEGRVLDGCITCPWHGFQYRPEDGRSPAPFTERIPTYRLRIEGARVLLDARANPPGTPVAPTPLPEGAP
ncbi:MAG: Rieske 2Fe-2S domain-containing protein [Pseudomonadota bacterium]